ncbi:fructose-bisphosphatase class II family protein [Cryobacterium sp. SO1]|uniref:fructose-bisphosphatase class II family protein n=1 Tax=Cryobacterium sp. SO1 TaxID=1897061 RepID=UPI0010231D94|nr:fructose-bisphosphatase class II family protein [Cryobacterium sp. SO1]RZI33957.1 Fructose-1,6-bisphosphatase class 2 [Cryobacterium sp. SO1]
MTSPAEAPAAGVILDATTVLGAEHYSAELVDAVRAATNAAAIAAGLWFGRGDKNAADAAAVAAMRAELLTAPFAGFVVIGEGEKDDAPMLANGEELGSGQGPACDIAVDPLDGTRLVQEGLPGSVCVIALAPRGTLFDPRDVFYMDKLISSAPARGVLDLRTTPTANVHRLAEALGKPVSEIAVAVLDKPRHASLVAELLGIGAQVELAGEGDVSSAIAAATPGGRIDLAMGIGGTPEGVLTACAVRALQGFMEGKLAPQTDEQLRMALAAGHDLDRVLTLDDLVASDRVLFASSPVKSE